MQTEQTLWTGRPSHIVNFGPYALCVLTAWLVVPIFIGLWKWLQLRSTEYTLTTERLRVRKGVLNKSTNTLELYRVKDFTVDEPLQLRLFGLANIVLDTSDKSDPVLTLSAVADAENLSDQIRRQVEVCRQGKVREVDMN